MGGDGGWIIDLALSHDRFIGTLGYNLPVM